MNGLWHRTYAETAASSTKNGVAVPVQELRIRVPAVAGRDRDVGAVQGVVPSTILEFAPQATTDLESQIWRHRNVAEVEQSMEIRSEQEAIRDVVLPTTAVWSYMGRLENW